MSAAGDRTGSQEAIASVEAIAERTQVERGVRERGEHRRRPRRDGGSMLAVAAARHEAERGGAEDEGRALVPSHRAGKPSSGRRRTRELARYARRGRE